MTVSVLAVHGNGGGGERFSWMAPHLPDDVALHAPTLPGFGGKPADPSLTDVAGYAEVLAEELTQLRRPRVALGTGIGGSFVLELARHHAKNLDGIILHAPVGPRLDTRLFPRILRQSGVARVVRTAIASRLTRRLVARRFFDADTPRDRVDQVLDAYSGCAVFGQQFQIIDGDWWRSLPQITVPAVVLWGEEERVLDADMAQDIRTVVPDAQIRTIKGWDHFPMIDDPSGYAGVIAQVARSLVSGG